VDPPKRERKRVVNYAENEYYRQAMKAGPGRASGPRLPKMPQLQDFQFFNVQRLMELYEKENSFEVFKHSQGQKEAALRSQVWPSIPLPFSLWVRDMVLAVYVCVCGGGACDCVFMRTCVRARTFPTEAEA
jgi:hypothetical protein